MRIPNENVGWVCVEYFGQESGEVAVRGIFKTFEELNEFIGNPNDHRDSEWRAQLFYGSELRLQKYMRRNEWVDQKVFVA